METKTKLNRVRMAPRKVRAVAGLLRGLNANAAIERLEHTIRKPAPVFKKLIKSAIANAENNFQMVASNLFIKKVLVDEGTKLRRFRPRAYGRASEIQKKTSHITIILDERVAGMKTEKKPKKDEEKHEHDHETEDTKHMPTDVQDISPTEKKRPEMKREIGKSTKKVFTGLKKRFFSRKSV